MLNGANFMSSIESKPPAGHQPPLF